MERYVVRDGIVNSLASDLLAAQGVIANNLHKRMMVLVDSPGIVMPSEDTYELSVFVVPIVPRSITASVTNVTPTIWGDFRVTDPEEAQHQTITLNPTLPWIGYVILTRSTIYSVDGHYEASCPVDPGSEGVHTLAVLTQSIELSDTLINNDDHIPLYMIEATGSGWTILQDYRYDHILSAIADPNITKPFSPTGLSLSSVAQFNILRDEASSGALRNVNTKSPHTNNMANRYLLKIVWDKSAQESQLWGYDVRITPMTGASGLLMDNMTMTTIVMANINIDHHELLWPVVEGVQYSVRLRAIHQSSNRVASDWCTPQTLLIGFDLISEQPAAPELMVQRLSYDPSYLMFNVNVPSPPPNPYFIQIVKQVNTAYGIGQSAPELVYEGNANDVRMILDLTNNPNTTFAARVVGPSGVCSPYSTWTVVPDGTPEGDPMAFSRYTISIPIVSKTSFPSGGVTAGSIFIAEFYPPAPGCTITDMSFIGGGSYEYRPDDLNTFCETFVDEVWFRVAPIIPDVDNSSILYLGAVGTDPLGIFPYFIDGHGGLTNGTPYDSSSGLPGNHYYCIWETDDNSSNTISEEQFQPDQKLYVYLVYDHNEVIDDAIVIINGTLNITIAPVES